MAVVAVLLVVSGCTRPSYDEIRVVLPAGFRGPFIVYADPNGTNCQQQGRTCVVVVPESRIVRLTTIAPFEKWHTSIGEFPDGTIIQGSTPVGELDVAMRYLGFSGSTGHRECLKFFVGTEPEAKSCDFSLLDSLE
jgi:hypothetical protein